MKDYYGIEAIAGDKIVYPVIRNGSLLLRDAQVARVLRTNGVETMEVLVMRKGKKPFATKYSTPERFVIMGRVVEV